MALFGKKTDRAADEQAANAEVERLTALASEELGVELIDAFGADGASKKNGRTAPMQIIQWLMASQPRGANLKPLVPAVLAGLQALENAGLLAHTMSGTGSGGQQFFLTPAGEQALADGSARAQLAG
jgi:hypothetical protein